MANSNLALLMNSLKSLHRQQWVLRPMSTFTQRDQRVSSASQHLIDVAATGSSGTQGVLIHATCKVKFLGLYIGAVTDNKGKRQYEKALEKRRRVVHRLRMLQKQRKESWDKEVGRLALNAFTRGYRKTLNTLRSGSKARESIYNKATELGMKAALTLTDQQPLLGSEDLKRLLEEEEDHFSRLGWDYLPTSVKLAYENLLLAMDEACEDLKAQSDSIKHQALSSGNQQLNNIEACAEDSVNATTELYASYSASLSHTEKQNMHISSGPDCAADTVRPTPELNHCGENIMKRLGDPDLLQAAYERIKSQLQRSSMKSNEEWKDFSLSLYLQTAKLLQAGTYQVAPVYEVHVKKSGKERAVRSVTVVTPRDQIIAEVIREELEKIYEPIFLEYAHGYQSSRSSHMALKYIKNGWKGTTWFVHFKPQTAIGNSQHDKLLSILSEKIKDDELLNLLKEMLKKGTISLGDHGNRLSTLLRNIFYHQLDVEVSRIKAEWNTGSKGYDIHSVTNGIQHLDQRMLATLWSDPGLASPAKQGFKNSQGVPHSEYARVRYIRHGEEFLFGITGPKMMAIDVLKRVRSFLHTELKLHGDR